VYALIFFLYSIIENPIYVLPIEILSGIAFALFYSGAISYANLLTPAGAEGTFQGVVGTAMTGIGLSYEYSGHFNILSVIHIIIWYFVVFYRFYRFSVGYNITYNKLSLYIVLTRNRFVLGSPVGSFIGGYMFKIIGSISSFKILSVLVLITCIVQIIVNQMIDRFSKKRNIKTIPCRGQP